MPFTLQNIPGFSDLKDTVLAHDLPALGANLQKINSNAAFGMVNMEFFPGLYKDGDTIPLPTSTVDGYNYSRNELLYIWGVQTSFNPATGWITGPDTLWYAGWKVDQTTGLVSTSEWYVKSDGPSTGRESKDGVLYVVVVAQRQRDSMTMAAPPPYYVDHTSTEFAQDKALTQVIMQDLNHNAKFGIMCTEAFYMGEFTNGQVITPPTSPIDGYGYATPQVRYVHCLRWTTTGSGYVQPDWGLKQLHQFYTYVDTNGVVHITVQFKTGGSPAIVTAPGYGRVAVFALCDRSIQVSATAATASVVVSPLPNTTLPKLMVSPDGTKVYYIYTSAGNVLHLYTYDSTTGALLAGPTSLSSSNSEFSIDPDGAFYSADSQSGLVLKRWDPNSGTPGTPTDTSGNLFNFYYRHVPFDAGSGTYTKWLYCLDIDNSEFTISNRTHGALGGTIGSASMHGGGGTATDGDFVIDSNGDAWGMIGQGAGSTIVFQATPNWPTGPLGTVLNYNLFSITHNGSNAQRCYLDEPNHCLIIITSDGYVIKFDTTSHTVTLQTSSSLFAPGGGSIPSNRSIVLAQNNKVSGAGTIWVWKDTGETTLAQLRTSDLTFVNVTDLTAQITGWSANPGSNEGTYVNSVAFDPANQLFYIAGQTNVSGTFTTRIIKVNVGQVGSYPGVRPQGAGFAEIDPNVFAPGSTLRASTMSQLNDNIRQSVVSPEFFGPYEYSDGDTIPLPTSAIDGYTYARSELCYIWEWRENQHDSSGSHFRLPGWSGNIDSVGVVHLKIWYAGDNVTYGTEPDGSDAVIKIRVVVVGTRSKSNPEIVGTTGSTPTGAGSGGEGSGGFIVNGS